MENKNITFNYTLEQYNKKYKNRRHRLLKYTKKQVEDFDNQYGHFMYKNKTYNLKYTKYLLKDRKWALIGDTYYEIPKLPRFTWFRNLNAGLQIATSIFGVAILVGVPTLIVELNRDPAPVIPAIDPSKTNVGIKFVENNGIGSVYSVFPKESGYKITKIDKVKIGEDTLKPVDEYLTDIEKNNLKLTIKKEAFKNHTGELVVTPYIDTIKVSFVEIVTSEIDMNIETELVVKVLPEDAKDKNVTFEVKSSQPEGSVVIIGNKIKATSDGKAVIVVKSNDGCATNEKELTINRHAVTGIKLNTSTITLNEGDDEYILTPTIFPNNASDRRIKWTSSNENVAIVGENGEVYSINPGSATITATTVDGGFTSTCAVTVNQTPSIQECYFSSSKDIHNINLTGVDTLDAPYFWIDKKGTYDPIGVPFKLKAYPSDLVNLEVGSYGASIMAKDSKKGGSGKIIVRAQGYKTSVLDIEVASFNKLNINCEGTPGPDEDYQVGAYNSFYHATDLGDIVLPSRIYVKSGSEEWWGKIKKIVGDDKYTSFYNNSSLTSIYIPDSITEIGEGGFSNCTNLKSVRIPSGLTTFTGYDFRRCSKLTKFIIDDNCKTFVTKADGAGLYKIDNNSKLSLSSYPSASGEVDLSKINNLIKLNKNCLFDNLNMTSIKLPSSLKTIADFAFGCVFIDESQLTKVFFTDTTGWKQIGGGAIDVTDPVVNATNLKNLISDSPNNWGYTGITKE